MCSERWWMRCHRAFIADTLHEMGFRVLHVIDLGRVERHRPLGVAPAWAARLHLDLLVAGGPGARGYEGNPGNRSGW